MQDFRCVRKAVLFVEDKYFDGVKEKWAVAKEKWEAAKVAKTAKYKVVNTPKTT